MTKKEIIEKYQLKKMGKENDQELIDFLLEGLEIPLKQDEHRNQ